MRPERGQDAQFLLAVMEGMEAPEGTEPVIGVVGQPVGSVHGHDREGDEQPAGPALGPSQCEGPRAGPAGCSSPSRSWPWTEPTGWPTTPITGSVPSGASMPSITARRN